MAVAKPSVYIRKNTIQILNPAKRFAWKDNLHSLARKSNYSAAPNITPSNFSSAYQ